ncbi:MAG: glycine--tRNA ligase subunit beta [Alphaproteobacteria bacterium]|nr:glycine--tRNA ligase subunit beta [Alphaproteobacteria bacterium]
MQLLLELFCEEIPARMQKRAADDLKMLISDGLKEASLSFEDAHGYVTPRRLAIVVDGIPEAQPDVSEERRGPRVDAPEKAIEGFLKGNGVTLDQCEKRDTGKGDFWFAVIDRKGRPSTKVLQTLLPEAIHKLSWQKSMRWGESSFRWVRPLQRVMCVLDGELLPLEIADGIPCGNVTTGHRFMGPEEFEVGFFDDYEKMLQHKKVILKVATRRNLIEENAIELAEADGFSLKHDPGLLAEVSGLVEWPVPLLGSIDAEFMALPDEVLTTSMRSHQKYFSVVAEDGKLAPRFVVVSNMEAADGGAAIVAGNERVLRARLADAKFFWDQDRKDKLETRVPSLSQMMFHEKLGTLEQKVARIEALAVELAPIVGADPEQARPAAHLCKADLMSGMVGEFASLQGVMGRYYALDEGEDPAIAQAIAEHYSPAGPDDMCPSAPVSIAVSLADKMDTLVGFFGIDEKPTGSRDPYGLRRAALGIIRMILENGIRLPLLTAFRRAFEQYGTALPVASNVNSESLMEFFADRLKVHLRSSGVRHDLIAAVFALGDEDDLVRLVSRVEALTRFLETDDGANLLAAHKRASNIVSIEEKKDNANFNGTVDPALLTDANESALFESMTTVVAKIQPLLAEEQYDDAMAVLAGLRNPLDNFFDEVTVNADDPEIRQNRLLLLSKIGEAMGEIAEFSQIEG